MAAVFLGHQASCLSAVVEDESPAVAKRDLFGLPGGALVEAFRLCAGGVPFLVEPVEVRIVEENELAYVYLDGFPVTEGHRLIIPKRHTADYFDLGQAEVNACHQLMEAQRLLIQQSDTTVTGFNVGINVGEDAGQTVSHCHIHLIPRRSGDTEDPIGGVRNVIAGAGNYKKAQQGGAGSAALLRASSQTLAEKNAPRR